ncbi:MAG: O-antigen ligase family protein [Patescibacteria group bacterium]|nr:O-antigen ligase family protein [Patescibacteria group bacterium]
MMAQPTPSQTNPRSEGLGLSASALPGDNGNAFRQNLASRAGILCGSVALVIGFTNPIAMSLTEVLLGVMAACWLLAGGWRERLNVIFSNPVAVASLAMLAFLAVSGLYGEAPLFEAVTGFVKYRNLLYLALFVSIFGTEGMREAGVRAFVAAMVVTLIAAFMAEAAIPPFHNHHARLGSDAGIFRNRIIQGLCMGLLAYLMLHRFTEEPRKRWPLGILALLAMWNTLFMLGGRSGYLALGGLLALFCVQRLRLRTLAYAGAVLGVVGVVGCFHSETILMRIGLVQTETAAYMDYRYHGGPLVPEGWIEPVTHTSCGRRLEFYRYGMNLFREHPLLGIGVGNVMHHLKAYPEEEGNGPAHHNLHSEFLMMAVQGGLVGLGLYLGLLAVIWHNSRKLSPHMRHLAQGMLVLTIVAGVVNSITIERTEGVLFAYCLGLAFSELAGRTASMRQSAPEDEASDDVGIPEANEASPPPLSRAA